MNGTTFDTVKGEYCNCMAQVVSQARIYEGQGQITTGELVVAPPSMMENLSLPYLSILI